MNLHKNRNIALLFLFAGCTIVASLFFKVEQTAKAQSFTDGFVKIRNKNWNRCLNLQSATQNGVATNAWECVAHPDQEWKIEGEYPTLAETLNQEEFREPVR
jgi:Ricin-type beta-trefoil lectin domain-like